MRYFHSSQKGQGLIEVLLTLLVLALTSIALIRFQGNLAYSNSVSQQVADATSLGVKQIETLRDFTVLTGSPSYQTINSGSSTSAGSDTTYTLTWTVTTFTNPNYKRIDVNITWTDRYGVARSVRLISQVGGINPANSAAII